MKKKTNKNTKPKRKPKQRGITNKSIMEIKWNHKNTQANRKQEKGKKNI